MTQDKEWSCGICTFLNKPLFLSCEMCGQDRPSQRPSPPQRQRSMDPAEFDDAVIEEEPQVQQRRNRVDRAPRSVQRHRSSAQVDIGDGVMGTLIMTDDLDDYETPDGKKEDDEEESLDLEEDPAMDNDRRRDWEPRTPRRSDVGPRRTPRRLPGRRHTFQTEDQYQSPRDRQAYMNQMNNSYNRLNGSYNNFDGSFSGSSRRRHTTTMSRPRQDIHIVGQSNGLPIVSVGGCGQAAAAAAMQRQSSSRVIMSDTSSQSQRSGESSIRGRRPSLAHSGSARHFDSHHHVVHHHHHHQAPPPPLRSMGPRGNSFASLPAPPVRNSATTTPNGNDFLPSLEPPPVPVMDNPADVDPQSVFANDQEKSNRRRSANELRRDRSRMLDSISPSVRSGLGRTTPAPVREDEAQLPTHPALLQDTEALDSPRTRKERKKLQRKKLKGAVKGLMASMRLAAVSTN